MSLEPAPWRAALLGFLIGLAAILGAWGFQLIGGYLPCKLCLQERLFYYSGLPLILLGLATAARLPRTARIAYALGGLVFLAGFGLGVYHAGAEWNFWAGPADCGGAQQTVTDAGSLLAQMQKTRLVSCTEATLRMFGLSFAGWNALASLAVAVLALRAATASPRSLI